APASTTAITDPSSPAADTLATPTDSTPSPSDQSSPPTPDSALSGSNIVLDPVDGYVLNSELPRLDNNQGAFTKDFPIVVPPGRNGLQPDVKLTYSSLDRDDMNIVGYGWSLNIPYIERLNKTGADQLYISNYYNSSLSGELVDLGSGSFGSKIDNGEFLTYTLSSNVWTVKDKKGTVYKFGTNAAERQDNPSDLGGHPKPAIHGHLKTGH